MKIPLPALALAVLAATAHAQLDIGSGGVPQDEIDAYAAPFFKWIASGLGSGHSASTGQGTGWDLGAAGILLPVPSGGPFRNWGRGVLPLFRLSAGAHARGAAAEVRGMAWRDPGAGSILTYGGGLAYARGLPGSRFELGLQAGWDAIRFHSAYNYYYSGSLVQPAGFVPGGYTLHENAIGGAATALYRRGRWKGSLQAGPEFIASRFQYLYKDPSDGQDKQSRSARNFTVWRNEAGVGWRGLHAEAGYAFYPYLAAGWTWTFRK